MSPERTLRADARRNVENIRTAAVDVFTRGGLDAALEEVARAAAVSKGTIYHRFGSREGLIDAVVDDVVADRLRSIVAEAEAIEDAAVAHEHYLLCLWSAQWHEPALNDVLLQVLPSSARAGVLCNEAQRAGEHLLLAAQRAGAVHTDITVRDVHQLTRERGLVARASRGGEGEQQYQRSNHLLLRALRSTAAHGPPGATQTRTPRRG